ncbi:undecaprenyl-diphosphate phosphatase [Nocardioides sp.]|uniref:undecaprenyl-diphosphate phosphatase n=1 Tax=Nocardioides sp. TaxID=35761 RepID=UPI0039E64D09
MSIFGAAALGVVEGLTEFLPISSTGHLKITESLLGYPTDDTSVVAFTAVIQVGAIAAVVVYFLRDIARIAGAWLHGLTNREARVERDYKFGWWVILATVPIVVAGLAAKPLIDGPLASLWVVAGSLVAGSAYMWIAERRAAVLAATSRPARGELESTFADAMVVGSSQILALLFPGFSRSGASISTGLLRGLDRVAATRLSFFLSIPALAGAGLYELKDAVGGGVGIAPLVVGTVISFVVAYAVVAWLLWFVAHYTFRGFIWYRLALAAALIVALAIGAVSA